MVHQPPHYRPRALLVGSAVLVALLAFSGLHPYDRATWWMEVAPVLIALPLMWATSRRFPLTPLLYALIFLHCCVLMLGGAYTYARVPLGFWMQDLMHLGRNPYDKIGHFIRALSRRLSRGRSCCAGTMCGAGRCSRSSSSAS